MSLRSHRSAAIPEEAEAGARLVLGLTLAVGGMATAIGLVVGDPMLIVGLPALVLGGALLVGRRDVGAWAGVAVWGILLPHAHGEAIVVPLLMAALCLAIAVGPNRLVGWLRQDLVRARERDVGDGWIEERDGRIG